MLGCSGRVPGLNAILTALRERLLGDSPPLPPRSPGTCIISGQHINHEHTLMLELLALDLPVYQPHHSWQLALSPNFIKPPFFSTRLRPFLVSVASSCLGQPLSNLPPLGLHVTATLSQLRPTVRQLDSRISQGCVVRVVVCEVQSTCAFKRTLRS